MDHHCKRSRWGRLRESTVFVGLASLLWLVFRTGTKPSRIVYPCQRAAAVNSCTLLNASLLPLMATAPKRTSRFLTSKKGVAVILVVVVVLGAALWWGTQRGRAPVSPGVGQEVGLTLSSQSATGTPASDIFVVNGTNGVDGGLGALIDLMGSHGLLFYRSETSGANRGPGGLIAKDDVVLIKVNSQWDERGGTNTDLLKKLIQTIVDHPDGFIGEIIVADNGQAQAGTFGTGGSLNWSRCNAEDQSQSVQKVVDSFSGSYRVSTYLWDNITRNVVNEYNEGDLRDGYVVNGTANPRTGIMVSYPKFNTTLGTYVSFKLGIWNPENQTYDSERLKVINVPVLKSHGGYGVTACVKHYMGVISDRGPQTRAHLTVRTGGMGTAMVETRFPVLNIVDAIWVNAVPVGGPGTSYGEATHVKVIMAGTDPVALDYWAAKHVLLQAATKRGVSNTDSFNPDNTRNTGENQEVFGVWLNRARLEMLRGGFNVTMDEAHMNVYVTHLSQASSSQGPSPQVVDHEPPTSPREATALNQPLPVSPQATEAAQQPPKRVSRLRAARD